MKKNIGIVVIAAAAALLLTGCRFSLRPKAPNEWYKKTLEYYSKGFENDWENEKEDIFIADEMKDDSNRFGYLLRDLNGDGTQEVLIGFVDDSAETRFIDLYIWHSDKGAFRIMHAGDGYYIYLCENNILREDSWYGSETKTRYMKYQSEVNSFLITDETATPQKWKLTEF